MAGPLGVLDAPSDQTQAPQTSAQTAAEPTPAPTVAVRPPTASGPAPQSADEGAGPPAALEGVAETIKEIRNAVPVSEGRERSARRREEARNQDRDPVRVAVQRLADQTAGNALIATLDTAGPNDPAVLSSADARIRSDLIQKIARVGQLMSNFRSAEDDDGE